MPPVEPQAQTYALARSLGTVADDSVTLDALGDLIAWAFEVRREGAPALAVAGARATGATIVLELDPGATFAGLLAAKALARCGAALEPGAIVTPPPECWDPGADLASVRGSFRLEAASPTACLRAIPVGTCAAIRIPLAKLEATLRKLTRLRQAEAPQLMQENELALVRALLARLGALGWSAETDPLPPELARIVLELRSA